MARDSWKTEEHHALQVMVTDFVRAEINPHVDEWEAARAFPAHTLFKQMAALDLLGVTLPVEYGGLGLDYSYGAALAEALGEISAAGVLMGIGVQTDMVTPALALHGSDRLRQEFLAPIIAGEMVCCIGVSEPDAGSDVAAIATTARVDGGDYVINGGKMWTTNGTQADWMCLLANTSDPGAAGPFRNKSLILLPLDAAGVNMSRKLDKLGLHSSDTAQFFFDDVRVPRRFLVGEEGMGFSYQMQQFEQERLWLALSNLRGMQRAIDETVVYARERIVFGKPVLDNQVVHYRLAELQTEIELFRALTYECVERHIAGEDGRVLTSMLKLKLGRLGRELADSCLQFFGGMGYVAETPISRYFRDIRMQSIAGGADEVMLRVIAKGMGTLPSRGSR